MDLSSQEETQNAFVAQEDDELWDVERITAERQSSRGKEYRVVWKGVDPKTGKPWPQSWVPRRDCTDDLVDEWKRVKKARSKASTSRASTSRVKAERHSSAVPPSISAARSPSVQPTGTKRKRQSAHSSAKHSDVVPPGGTEVVYAREEEEEDEEAPVAPPKAIQPHKKRKVQVEIDTPPPTTRLKRAQPIEPQPASSPIEPFSQSFEEVERGLQVSEPETDDQDRVARRSKKPLSTTSATTTTASLSPPPTQLPPNIKIGPPRRTKSGSRVSIVGGNTTKKTNGIKKTKSKANVVEPPPPPSKTKSKDVKPEVEHDDALPPEPPLDAYATTDPGLDDEGAPPPVSPTSPPRTDSVPSMEWSKAKASLSDPPIRKPLVEVEPLDLSQSQDKIHLAPPTRPVGKSPSLQEAARSAFRAVVEKPMEVLSIFWEGKNRGASGSAPEVPVPVQRVEVVEDDPESRLSPAAIRRLKKWEKDLGVIEEWERKKREKENARRGKESSGKGKEKEKERAKEKEQREGKEKEVEVVNTSYSGEIVPETQSQIPRDKSPTPPHTLALATLPPPNNVPAPVPVPQTPNSLHRQDSLRARMKPRTPRSASRPLSRAETAPSALFAPHAPKFNLMTNALPPLPDDDGDPEDENEDADAADKCLASTSTSVEVVAPTSLRPAPLVSSNDFSPYLNLDAPSGVVDEVEVVVSSLETAKDSIVDADGSSLEAGAVVPNGKDKGKEDAHDSSIEQFEKRRVDRKTTTIVQVKAKQTKPCGPIPGTTALTEDTDFVAKGMEIAERVKRQQAAETEKRGRKRLPLQDRRDVLDRVVANRARSRSEEVAGLSGDDVDGDVLSRRHSSPEWDMGDMGKVYEGGEDVEARDDRPAEGLGHMTMDDLTKAFEEGEDLGALDEDNDEDNDDARTPAKPTSPPAPAPRPLPAAESLTATDADMTYPSMTMDDIVAAYNQPDAIDPLMLREEEEETTQDVATEAQPQHLQPLPTVVEEPEATEDAMDVEVKAPSASGSDDGRSAVPEIVIEGASRAPSVTTSPTTTDGARPPPSRRTRSTRSRSNTPAPAPAPPPARRLRSQSREPDPVPSKVHKGKGRSDPSEHLSSLLTAKSEEIARLDAQLESLRASFQTQLSTLSTRLSEAQSSNSHLSDQLSQTTLELQKRTTELEAAKKAKTSAENDKEFMREQYLRSSAYVSDIRDENKALELRASVAEGQVSTGLAMVKATFEQRIKVLEADVKSWRRMAEFLMEKDRRTDDDVRKRAAEEPELRRKVKRVKLELEAARNEIDMLGDSLEEKEEQLQGAMVDVGRERREKAELLVALEEAEDKLRRLGMSGTATQESMGSEGHEFVYRCKWRVEDGQSCSEAFSTIRALQQHLYEGHLPP